jgi:predicted ATP-grasp superfamily ATP-dependent carboligase
VTSVFVYEYLSGGGEALPSDDPGAVELLAQGRAMRDALAADLAAADTCELSVAACALAPPDDAIGPVARWVQPAAGQAAEAFVRNQAARHDLVFVIAPESGACLARLAAVVAPHTWTGCSLEAIERAGSKSATAQALRASGVTAPRRWVPGMAADPDATAYVVKPDDGAGCSATHHHARFSAARSEYLARSARGEAVTMESWIDGTAMSLSLRVGAAAGGAAPEVELLSINQQHIELRHGSVHYRGVSSGVLPPESPQGMTLSALARQVVAALPGLAGFVGIDLVWHPQRGPVVIEVNPRLTCAYVGLSRRLGRNLGAELVQAHLAASRAVAAPPRRR